MIVVSPEFLCVVGWGVAVVLSPEFLFVVGWRVVVVSLFFSVICVFEVAGVWLVPFVSMLVVDEKAVEDEEESFPWSGRINISNVRISIGFSCIVVLSKEFLMNLHFLPMIPFWILAARFSSKTLWTVNEGNNFCKSTKADKDKSGSSFFW